MQTDLYISYLLERMGPGDRGSLVEGVSTVVFLQCYICPSYSLFKCITDPNVFLLQCWRKVWSTLPDLHDQSLIHHQ